MDGSEIISEADENLGSLIRASIDIDAWISNGKMQLDAQESGFTDDRDSNVFSQEDERNIVDNFEPWSSELCEKELCELGKCKNTLPFLQPECLPAMEIRDYVVDGENSVQENRQQTNQYVQQFQQTDEQAITLEKTPEQTRYEDVVNQKQALEVANQVEILNKSKTESFNFGKTTSLAGNHQKLPSFQDAFGKNRINSYVDAKQGSRIRQDNERQVIYIARKTTNCYKCREIIKPRDWIRSITAGTGDFTAVYHMNCFSCDYCKGVLCTDQYYTFHQGKLICNFDFQMLTNLRKVPDTNQKRLVVLHSVKKGSKKSVRISLEQKEILQQALRSRDRPRNVKKSS